MRNRRLLGTGLAALALGLATAIGPDPPAVPASATLASGAAPASGAGRPCGAFPGAHQLPGADGVVPAAWSGGGLAVPACGPAPGDGTAAAPVFPYPDAPWTAGYQCVEFSERYLYERYGVMMDIPTDGDQVAAHYAAGYPGLFIRWPATGTVAVTDARGATATAGLPVGRRSGGRLSRQLAVRRVGVAPSGRRERITACATAFAKLSSSDERIRGLHDLYLRN